MRIAVLAVAALLALAGCGSDVTKEQADTVCVGLAAGAVVGTGGVAFTHNELQEKYGLTPPEASDVMREAVRDYCPQYQRLVG